MILMIIIILLDNINDNDGNNNINNTNGNLTLTIVVKSLTVPPAPSLRSLFWPHFHSTGVPTRISQLFLSYSFCNPLLH